MARKMIAVRAAIEHAAALHLLQRLSLRGGARETHQGCEGEGEKTALHDVSPILHRAVMIGRFAGPNRIQGVRHQTCPAQACPLAPKAAEVPEPRPP